jgi:diguanylate cyclase (GGDEF)-like protein
MRGSDTLLRWGGEEFLLVMPNTDMGQARRALQRLTESGLGLRPDGTRLTASIGVAERCLDKVVSPTALLELADHRMYRAKTGGRDQICSTPDDQPEPESCSQKAYC